MQKHVQQSSMHCEASFKEGHCHPRITGNQRYTVSTIEFTSKTVSAARSTELEGMVVPVQNAKRMSFFSGFMSIFTQ